jgi:uncharacterized protein YbjT (DUF2867 family)
MEMDILLIGATGTVGSAVANESVPGVRVRALVRSRASAARLPAGVEPVFGDLRDPAALRRAFQGVRAALYVAPHEPDEEALTGNVILACNEAGARLVYVGVHADGSNRVTRALRRGIYGRFLPHYAPKFRQSERVRQGVGEAIILMPSNFFQNDELFREALEAGRFAPPFAKPVNRVDVRDVAVAARRALTEPSVGPGAYSLLGPESLTGEQCAKSWSQALGRPVRVEADQAQVAALLRRTLEGKKRDDFTRSYEALSQFALPTEPRALAQTTALLGRPPTSYESYVREVVARWRAGRSSPEAAGSGARPQVA